MKFGIIDEKYMNTLATRTDEFEDMKKSLQQIVGLDLNRGKRTFLAFLTAAEEIASYDNKPIAWKYDWARVDLGALPRFLSSEPSDEEGQEPLYTERNYKFVEEGDPNEDGGENNSTSEQMRLAIDEISGYPFQRAEYQCYAYNLAELTNIITVPIVCGIDTDAEGYPTDYQLREASGLVWLTQIRDCFEGNVHYIFDRMGIHDGECDT